MALEPVVIDLETRSACDLRAHGGRAYALHPTTRLLTVAWAADGEEHVWLPGADAVPADYIAEHLPGVTVHYKGDGGVPAALSSLLGRQWVGHNCDTFDRLVWRECCDSEPAGWIDTYPLALSIGLPGGLNKIGQLLWGEGKYEKGSKALKKAMEATSEEDCEPDNVPIGSQVLVARYNVQDVRLTKALHEQIRREYKAPPSEAGVYAAHRAVNDRGMRFDRDLLYALIKLDDDAMRDAKEKIKVLTNGRLKDEHDLRSNKTMRDWLKYMGVDLGSSLARKVVEKWIETNKDPGWEKEDEPDDAPADGDRTPSELPTVVRVLELRASALRITGGKLFAATQAIADDGFIRDLHVYHAAHSGRWAARKVQTHNLPRPKPGVDVWHLIDLFERTGRLDLDAVREHCDPNDAASALLRSLIIPGPGEVIADADLAQIEARVLAWLAGERWVMDAYWGDEDLYVKFAEAIAGPKEKWPNQNPKDPKYKKHEYRQTIGKVPALGAGYQMGAAKLLLTALSAGIDPTKYGTTAEEIVVAYRRKHPAIAGVEAGEYNGRPYFKGGLWDQLNDAAIMAAERGGPVPVGPVDFQREGKNLIMVLPSGRRFVYRDVLVEERSPFGRPVKVLSYMHPRYGRKVTYGGAQTENVVQAISRDVIADCVAACERERVGNCLHVHDQAASCWAVELSATNFPIFMRCMSTPAPWLSNFPLDAEGSMARRWAKSPPKGTEEQVWRNGKRHK